MRARTRHAKKRNGFSVPASAPASLGPRSASRAHLGLTAGEFAVLRRLRTPDRIQAYLNATPINHELEGETVLSAREVIRQRRAHCIEGAMFAACGFSLLKIVLFVPCWYPGVCAGNTLSIASPFAESWLAGMMLFGKGCKVSGLVIVIARPK